MGSVWRGSGDPMLAIHVPKGAIREKTGNKTGANSRVLSDKTPNT